MIKNFVRGGQVTLHYIRMMRQVLHFLYVAAVLTFLLGSFGYLTKNTSDADRTAIIQYYAAKLKVGLGQGDAYINIVTPDKKRYQLKAKVVANYPGMIKHATWFWGVFFRGLELSAYFVIFQVVVVSGFFLWRGKNLSTAEHIRGGKIATPEELKRAITRDNKKQGVDSYSIAGIPFPAYAESQHTFITGSPGAGKTVVISELIEQIRQRGDRAIIYDKMGSYVKWFHDAEKDIILNPFDARSVNWSVFNEARSDADFDTIAAALIPTQKGIADPFWTEAARTLFSNVCAVLKNSGLSNNKVLLQTLLRTDLTVLAQMLKGTPAQAIVDEQNSKTALSVMSVLSTNVGSMKHLRNSGAKFSIREWINDEESSNFLFVTSRSDQHASVRPLITTWLEIAINSLLSLEQSRDRKIWIIIDELPSLLVLPSLPSGLAESRQFGGAVVLSSQVMHQLQAIYGQDIAKAISGLCQTRLVFKSSDSETARLSAESLGGQEIEEHRESMSYGAHEMRDGVNLSINRSTSNLILPTTIMNLPNLTSYIRFGMEYPVAKVKIPYVSREEIAKRFVPIEEEVTEEVPISQLLVEDTITVSPKVTKTKKSKAVPKEEESKETAKKTETINKNYDAVSFEIRG